MTIDSHTHINSKVLSNPLLEISKINNYPSLSTVINIGLDIETSKEVTDISIQNPKFYSSVGIHPLYTENQNIDELINLAIKTRVVAIGEIGLDYSKPNYDEQKKYLISQIIIANELHLPVIIHANNTNKEVIDVFKKVVKPLYGCVFHCFQPDLESLKYLMDNNYYISFTGRITYLNAKKSLEIARLVPSDLFLVETDSPYLSPEPIRYQDNSSTNLHYIIKKISEIRNTSYEEIQNQSTQNTLRLFKKMKK